MAFAVGSLVKTRGREWVVLPESEDDFLVLRPLGGSDDEITGLALDLEAVEPASFALPNPRMMGDHRSCRLMRDAVRIGFRSSAGPFRSFGHLAVDPRPYQLVPLLMALKMEPVRLLIGDDVGIGKTIESALIARELLERGEIHRAAVLCPPHLAEQWQAEMSEKFHLEMELVLASTAARLERDCGVGESLFQKYPFTIVSLDFIKSERRRHEFINNCPEFIIVDEAHACAHGQDRRGSRHQRYQLLRDLALNPERHIILVTATPHSGDDEDFRSLITLLNPKFKELPADIRGKENEVHRRLLAQHFVQRRRPDIRKYLEMDTSFPQREERELSYRLSPQYKTLFEKVLAYARESVKDLEHSVFRQRLQWWSSLALLRALASSPAAAAATLRNRAAVADAEDANEADAIGSRLIMDMDAEDAVEAVDLTPGSDIGEQSGDEKKNRRFLLGLAREADELQGEKDEKLKGVVKELKQLLKEGYRPIVFCRFIATADYLAEELRGRLARNVNVVAVTGNLPHSEREERIAELGKTYPRVLVATDCLSEGINLQQHFDAVIHYDLSWNPTRQEQREGRVDRFGQESPTVRILTYYGLDNQIDGIVLDVLLRKHRLIRNRLGISLPVPVDSSSVMAAIYEGLLLRGESGRGRGDLSQGGLFDDFLSSTREQVHSDWEKAADKEKASRTLFAQASIRPDEVAKELQAVKEAMGSNIDVQSFFQDALSILNGYITKKDPLEVDLTEVPTGLKDIIPDYVKFKARFELPVAENVIYLTRTHPLMEGLGQYIMNSALDEIGNGPASRCGVVMTDSVQRRSTLLLVRFRYHIICRKGNREYPLLAEDCQILAFQGPASDPVWLPKSEAELLIDSKPTEIVTDEKKCYFMDQVIDNYDNIRLYLEETARIRGDNLLEAHTRVRQAANIRGTRYRIEPQQPPDLLGIYIYLPSVPARRVVG